MGFDFFCGQTEIQLNLERTLDPQKIPKSSSNLKGPSLNLNPGLNFFFELRGLPAWLHCPRVHISSPFRSLLALPSPFRTCVLLMNRSLRWSSTERPGPEPCLASRAQAGPTPSYSSTSLVIRWRSCIRARSKPSGDSPCSVHKEKRARFRMEKS